MTKQAIKNGVKYKLKKLINFFFKGLLVCLPILLTYYVVSSVVLSVDKIIPINIPLC